MQEQGSAITELRKGPPPGVKGHPKWMGQQANRAKGLSHSGKNPASGLGKPYVLCSNHLDKKCPGWATLEALTINPFCACG
eukprot:8327375-Karenia_brevis.AAC.1